MKIKITTNRRPWANNMPHNFGDIVTTDDDVAKALIKAGFAEEVKRVKSDD